MLSILLLCDKPKKERNANTILDHINAFEHYSNHNILTYSNLGDFSETLLLNKFDVIIVHYSISIVYDNFISPSAKEKLREFSGLKVLFIQDEYRRVNKAIAEIEYINFDILFSCFPDSELEKIYPNTKLPGLKKYNNLTGYIPDKLLNLPNLKKTKQRPIDVGYRGRKIPFWLGELSYEKWSIVDAWNAHTNDSGLITNISYHEEDRIYGQSWIDYITSCKTTLGVESGASIIDFTGRLETIIDFHQRTFPDDTFHDIQNMYLKEHEGLFKLNQISPRCFEAIALKTVLVLYEGEYSGILIPGRHYISLKKDFSNIREVLDSIKDTDYLQNMADKAYEEIGINSKYSYQTFIKNVDNIISKEFILRGKNKVILPYNIMDFLNDIKTIKEKNIEILPPLILENLNAVSEPEINSASLIDQWSALESQQKSKSHAAKLFYYLKKNYQIDQNQYLIKFKLIVTRKIKLFNPILRLIKKHVR